MDNSGGTNEITVADNRSSGSQGGNFQNPRTVPTGDPTGLGNNLLNIIAQDSTSYLVQSSQAEQSTKENLIAASGVSSDISKLNEQAASDKAIVQLTQDTAALNAQKLFLSAANNAGVNPMGAADIITKSLTDVTESGARWGEAADRLAKTREAPTGMIDWFSKRFQGAIAQQDMKTAALQQDVAMSRLNNMNKVISESQRLAGAVQESMTADSVAASSRLAANSLQIAAKNAELDSLKYGGMALSVAKEATKDRLNVLYNIQNALRGEKFYQLQLEQFNKSFEEFDWRKEYQQERLDAKKEGMDLDGYTLDTINIGRGNRGLPPLEGREAKQQLMILKTGGLGVKELNEDYARGQATRQTGVPMLGVSPAETAALFVTKKIALPVQRQGVGQLLTQAYEQVKDDNIKYPKPEDKAAAINNLVQNSINSQWKSIKAGSGNLFDFGDLASYIQLSGIADLPVVQKVLAPAAVAKQPLSDPNIYTALVADAVYKGTITSSQASDLATVIQKANEIHLAASGFKAAGIQVPLDGKAYNARMGTTFGNETVNITNNNELSRYINMLLSQKAFGQGTGKNNGITKPSPAFGTYN